MKTRIKLTALILTTALTMAQVASAQTDVKENNPTNSVVQPADFGASEALVALVLVTASGLVILYRHIAKKLRPPPPPPGKYNINLSGSLVPGCDGYYVYHHDSTKPFGSYYVNDTTGFALWGAPTDNTGTNDIWTITDAAFGGSMIVATKQGLRDFFIDTNAVPIDDYVYAIAGVYYPLGPPFQNLQYWSGYPSNHYRVNINLGWDRNNPIDNAALISPLNSKTKTLAADTSDSPDSNFYAAWFIIASSDANDPADPASLDSTLNANSGALTTQTGQPLNSNTNVLDTNWVALVKNNWGCIPNLANSSFGYNGNPVTNLPNLSIQFTNGVLIVVRTNSVVYEALPMAEGQGYQVGDIIPVPGGAGHSAQLEVSSVISMPGLGITNAINSLSIVDPGLYVVNPPSTFACTTGSGKGASVIVLLSPTGTITGSASVPIKRGVNLSQMKTLMQIQTPANTPVIFDDDNASATAAFYSVH